MAEMSPRGVCWRGWMAGSGKDAVWREALAGMANSLLGERARAEGEM